MQVSPTRIRIPDVVVTPRKVTHGILREQPFLCIEILSPEDRASRIEKKIDDYLRFGVRNVWIIDPADRTGWAYTREGRRESTGMLTTADPALTLSLKEVFEALEEDVEQ